MPNNFLKRSLPLLLFLCGISGWLLAQQTSPPHGLHTHQHGVHAFTNATIVTAPGKTIQNGTLVIKDGLVLNVGGQLTLPPDAVVHDMAGAWIFPGFIDPWSHLGLTKPKRNSDPNGGPQYTRKDPAPSHWNEAVKPEYHVTDEFKADAKDAKQWRDAGFTAVHTVPYDGIFRGHSALVLLGEDGPEQEVLDADVYGCMSFDKGVSTQQYPSSLMGSIALIRQTFLDATWYTQARKSQHKGVEKLETNLALEAIAAYMQANRTWMFEVSDWQDILRVEQIAAEAKQRFVYKGKGDEYKRLDLLAKLGRRMIVPLKFPKAMDIKDPADARYVNLGTMLHWEAAPANPARMSEANMSFALTAEGLKNGKEFWESLQKAMRHGLSMDDALEALTLTPAKILKADDRMGTLEPGKFANFFIAEGNVFEEEKPVIYETWVQGKQHAAAGRPEWDVRATYDLSWENASHALLIGGKPSKPEARWVVGEDTLKGEISVQGRQVSFVLPASKGKETEKIRLSGLGDDTRLQGIGTDADGNRITWTAKRSGKMPEFKKDKKEEEPETFGLADLPVLHFPNKAYGWEQPPQQDMILIRDATVWTNTDKGVLQRADILIANGKIKQMGMSITPPSGTLVIEGKGMHLTPGLIDEHSHIAVARGVNEGSHAVTAEVRISDVINCEDVNIYRQLAGGVTTSQLLHGSANPIGGQSALIKLRWGLSPEEMKFEAAPGFIKFALGENVKQSNWGDRFRSRYPQSRLGVEQLIRDAFQAALDYRAEREAWSRGGRAGLPPRRDLQMEAVLEILDQERFITCHSYVQSEINMLMKVCEDFGFRVNTFTHILEGYKIADKLARHGASGSTFSDWWAYKYEVIDAIPYNAALMSSQGINVCINSDDAEMGRRLNQEAAKAVKYGGASEEEALKMVTLNPAKALRIDDRVGTVEVGKDADLVLWTDHPLSVYARASKTLIDGTVYYDADKDAEHRAWIQAERKRLIRRMMLDPDQEKAPVSREEEMEYHCDTYESDYNHE